MSDNEAATVVRIGDPSELVAGLPALFGFTPRESLVVLSLGGERERIGFRLRHDLVPPEDTRGLAVQLVEMLVRNGASNVLVVGCSTDAELCAENVDALCEVLEHAGIGLRDALRCDGRRWWSYTCQERCCPEEGTPYDPLSSQMVAEAVVHGVAMVPDRADLGLRFSAVRGAAAVSMAAATERALADVTSTLQRTGASRRGTVDRGALEVGVQRIQDTLGRALGGTPVGDADAATLSVWCGLVPVRDIAWAQVTRADAADHLDVWSQVARKVVSPWEPAVLSLAAFCAWLSGDGALAWFALDRVEQVDPTYSMAELIRETLRRGLPPDSWVPVDEELIWDSVGG